MSRQLLEYHPTIGYRFIPNLKARVEHESGGYLVRVNSAGFRCNRDFTPARTSARRVLLFGDSFSAGDGVSNEKRYSDVLESLIPNLEVYNFALPGTGTDQQYLAYREMAGGIEHDVLLISVLVENIRRIVARYRVYVDDQGRELCYAKPYYERSAAGLTLCNVPVRKDPIPTEAMAADEGAHVDRGGRFATLRKVVNALGLREVVQKMSHYQPLPDYDRPDSPAWLLMRAILEQWIRAHERPVVLMPIPLHQYIEGTADARPYQARFSELAAAVGCTLHDPLPDLMQRPAAERRGFRFKNDVHPTPAGHAALAASLAPTIERLLPAASAVAALSGAPPS
ncbi:GDSL-like Lipase/Acylhydrolase [Phycisphaerae bacterium RAS1]|nr:GDSL-like Lipase/Acylhydrolase [Phycisphaerae bacterium RAS1]